MLSFTAWSFAALGALCAAGPLLIHLLNRRRYRVIPWAAMDFLRQALKQQRRIMRMRDLVLLILRTAAVLLFGLALARPYWSRGEAAMDASQSVHAIVAIDNSLSMGYESLEGSLLARAKDAARQYIEALPAGSRCTLIAACGGRDLLSRDPYGTKESALEALESVAVVDRSLSLAALVDAIESAATAAPELGKSAVLFTDQQELNWRGVAPGAFAGSPAPLQNLSVSPLQNLSVSPLQTLSVSPLQTLSVSPLQIVSVAPPQRENAWISNLRLQDGLADVETPATVVVEVAHQGLSAGRDVQVSLSLGEVILGQKSIRLETGGGRREVEFACEFGGLTELPEASRPVYAVLRASITPDRLPLDDERVLSAPVVASLSVVFIDQYGAEGEDAAVGRLGETRHLRRLLAPRTSRALASRQLVRVRHLAPQQVTREQLADARLVVVAGVADPGEMAALLEQYVLQGGQLLIAAGADFDAARWNAAAWRDGQGFLPLPLLPEPLGKTPEESLGELKPFFLSQESVANEPYFQLAGVAPAELEALYAEPLFFKAVEVDETPASATGNPPLNESLGNSSESPAWLQWAAPEAQTDSEAAGRSGSPKPRVRARYDLPGKPAFLVSRKVGRGGVVLCTTGVLSSWSTLPKTNAFLIFDRILRDMLEQTLPERNFATLAQLSLPLPGAGPSLRVTVQRPQAAIAEPVDVAFVSAAARGISLSGLGDRGVYRVRGTESTGDSASSGRSPAWEMSLAVNGPAEESDLSGLGQTAIEQLRSARGVRLVASPDAAGLTGAGAGGRNSWWWLMAITLCCLGLEMAVLGAPAVYRQFTSFLSQR